jgi:hypothetical protein
VISGARRQFGRPALHLKGSMLRCGLAYSQRVAQYALTVSTRSARRGCSRILSHFDPRKCHPIDR